MINGQRAAAFLASVFALAAAPALAQEGGERASAARSATSSNDIDDNAIVVTAQKRSQSINKVGMSIAAASGQSLVQRGISDPSDLSKLVPGFTAQTTPTSAPVYTLRGVGYYEQTLSVSPAVSVYLDEVPLPFSIMTKGVAFDLERVEVLKGPQGTLYGQNSTGGAINYIAAKPTDTWTGGMSLGLGRFATGELQGFVSGPIGQDVSIRVAARSVLSGNWQKSYTRDEGLGQRQQYQGRMLIDWRPSDRLSFTANFNGWVDKGDSQAAQLIAVQIEGANPVPGIVNYPLAPKSARAADWTPDFPYRDDRFWQSSLRAQYDLTDDIALTSITAYSDLKANTRLDADATSFMNLDRSVRGRIKSFSQELRLSGNSERLNWLIGANYQRDKTFEQSRVLLPDASNNIVIPGLVLSDSSGNINSKVRTVSAFGNIEYEIVSDVRLQGGLRYTKSRNHTRDCVLGNQAYADTFAFIAASIRGDAPAVLRPYLDCIQIDDTGINGNSATFQQMAMVENLDQNNLSWRAGISWQVQPATLGYLNVSRGYKSGAFSSAPALLFTNLKPVTQESLTAYELGFKSRLAPGFQINGAAFQYNYSDKQIYAKYLDPIFGVNEQLANIPKSRVRGAEIEIQASPMDGLAIGASATYLDASIRKYTGLDLNGVSRNMAGSRLPFTPKWTGVVDAQYDFPLSGGLGGFVGGNLTYSGSTNSSVGYPTLYKIPTYALLDLRAGMAGSDDSWMLTVWGRNVTNKYYWTNVFKTLDTVQRYAGMPATYGVTFALKWH